MTLQVSVSTCPLDAMERPLFRDTSSGPNRRRFGLMQGPSSFAGWLYEPCMELWATATVYPVNRTYQLRDTVSRFSCQRQGVDGPQKGALKGSRGRVGSLRVGTLTKRHTLMEAWVLYFVLAWLTLLNALGKRTHWGLRTLNQMMAKHAFLPFLETPKTALLEVNAACGTSNQVRHNSVKCNAGVSCSKFRLPGLPRLKVMYRPGRE